MILCMINMCPCLLINSCANVMSAANLTNFFKDSILSSCLPSFKLWCKSLAVFSYIMKNIMKGRIHLLNHNMSHKYKTCLNKTSLGPAFCVWYRQVKLTKISYIGIFFQVKLTKIFYIGIFFQVKLTKIFYIGIFFQVKLTKISYIGIFFQVKLTNISYIGIFFQVKLTHKDFLHWDFLSS